MIFRDANHWLEAVLSAPVAVRHSFKWTIKVAFDIFSVKRVIDDTVISRLDAVEVVAKGDVQTRMCDMLRI
jgi:hypothetical protein